MWDWGVKCYHLSKSVISSKYIVVCKKLGHQPLAGWTRRMGKFDASQQRCWQTIFERSDIVL